MSGYVKLNKKEIAFIVGLGKKSALSRWTELKISKTGIVYFYDYAFLRKLSFIEGMADYGENIPIDNILEYKNGLYMWNHIFEKINLLEYVHTEKEANRFIERHTKNDKLMKKIKHFKPIRV